MNKKTYKKHSAAFKKQVTIASIEQKKTMNELCQDFNLHESQIHKWRAEGLEILEEGFKKKRGKKDLFEQEVALLQRKVGELTMERDFLANAWSRYQGNKKRK